MERESFEDKDIAALLNAEFVCIKVDREERPDIDHIYMEVCHALTGSGGWPLTIFMTPDKKPFYAGTYFPKESHMGMPGLISVLKNITAAWEKDRQAVTGSAEKIIEVIQSQEQSEASELTEDAIHQAYESYKYMFDDRYGGFGDSPKFPSPHILTFLLRYWYRYKEETALDMVEKTLVSMYRGGIFDHIGYGFSRYSTDRRWLVPHFEKMLYDNALLAIAYLETYQATGKELYKQTAKRIFEYTSRELMSEHGGFYSAQDADSEGIEGKFYIWTKDEILKVLGKEQGEEFCNLYDVTSKGNLEGFNIPNLLKSDNYEETDNFSEASGKKLFEYREKRVHPFKDDKILTSWNGLMIAAMAIGGRILEDKVYTSMAEKVVSFIFKNLVRNDGRLMARYRDGETAIPGYADDYAYLIWGLIELYQTTYNPKYIKRALELNDDLIKYFWDYDKGGLFIYGSDSEQLLSRPKEIYDGALPSANSVEAMNLIRLARLTGRNELEQKAVSLIKAFGEKVETAPAGYTFFLSSLLYKFSPAREVVIAGDSEGNTDEFFRILNKKFNPFTTILYVSTANHELTSVAPFVQDYKPVEGKTTAFVCENNSCQAPITDSGQLSEMI